MKKLILSLIISIYITGVYGQQRKSITDTIFPLKQANLYGTLKHKVNLLNLDVPLKKMCIRDRCGTELKIFRVR